MTAQKHAHDIDSNITHKSQKMGTNELPIIDEWMNKIQYSHAIDSMCS